MTTAGTTYVINLPYTRPPLTWNDRHNRWKRAEIVRNVRADVGWLARQAGIPSAERIVVQLHYAPGRKGRRDPMNFTATSKPAIDGLVDVGIVPDDDSEHVYEPPPEIHYPPEPGPRCWLAITLDGGAS